MIIKCIIVSPTGFFLIDGMNWNAQSDKSKIEFDKEFFIDEPTLLIMEIKGYQIKNGEKRLSNPFTWKIASAHYNAKDFLVLNETGCQRYFYAIIKKRGKIIISPKVEKFAQLPQGDGVVQVYQNLGFRLDNAEFEPPFISTWLRSNYDKLIVKNHFFSDKYNQFFDYEKDGCSIYTMSNNINIDEVVNKKPKLLDRRWFLVNGSRFLCAFYFHNHGYALYDNQDELILMSNPYDDFCYFYITKPNGEEKRIRVPLGFFIVRRKVSFIVNSPTLEEPEVLYPVQCDKSFHSIFTNIIPYNEAFLPDFINVYNQGIY